MWWWGGDGCGSGGGNGGVWQYLHANAISFLKSRTHDDESVTEPSLQTLIARPSEERPTFHRPVVFAPKTLSRWLKRTETTIEVKFDGTIILAVDCKKPAPLENHSSTGVPKLLSSSPLPRLKSVAILYRSFTRASRAKKNSAWNQEKHWYKSYYAQTA